MIRRGVKTWFLSIALVIMLVGAACPVLGAVDLVNSTNVSTDQFEQFWHYSIKVYLNADAPVQISALEANVTFDNTIFYDVEITDQIAQNSIWETDLVDDHFETNGNATAVKYLKASNNGDYWSIGAGQHLLYTLSFKVSNNATPGLTNFLFDPNFAKVQDNNGDNVTGILINGDYNILTPQNGPIDVANAPNPTLDTFERNKLNGYSEAVKEVITPVSDSKIKEIEVTLTYNNTIFYDVTISDKLGSWDTNIANANYAVNGDITTIKYVKKFNDYHDSWTINGGTPYTLYTLTFKVKRDAPLGVTYFGSAIVEVTSNAGENIKGSVSDHAFSIINPTNGSINLISTPNNSDGNYERNHENQPAGYSNKIKVMLEPQASAEIWSLEATTTYNNTIFYDVSLSDVQAGGGPWANTDVNVSYAVNGDVTTIKYFKEASYEGRWAVSSPQALYTLSFKVTRNAELGDEHLYFVPTIKVYDPADQDITGVLSSHAFSILTDNTIPNTSVNTAGGWFNAAQSIDLWTNETNNEVTTNYTLDDTDPKTSTSAVHVIKQVSGIIIPTNNDILITTLNYYANDWALDKTPNEEASYHTQVYIIDSGLPSINIVAYDTGPATFGDVIRITFNVLDSSGEIWQNDPAQAIAVQLSGQNMTRVTGNGLGMYVYERLLNGAEGEGWRDIDISAKDKVNNQAQLNLSGVVRLDFAGPTLVVSATPNPAAHPEIVTITVQSSEDLATPPTVSVSPGHYATFVAQSGFDYYYHFQVTGNGWAANVPWLGSGVTMDVTPPVISDVVPTPSAIAVDFRPTFSFTVSDDHIVDTANIQLIIKGALVPTADLLITRLVGEKYKVSYVPQLYFEGEEVVLVTINVSDSPLAPNPYTMTYSFITDSTTPSVRLKVYLQGYYIPASGYHRPATLNLQFRSLQKVAGSISFNVAVDNSGFTEPLYSEELIRGTPYYLLIRHFLPGKPIGGNHLPLVLNEPIIYGEKAVFIDLTTPPEEANDKYKEPYMSNISQAALSDDGVAKVLKTESNGKLVIRGGNAEADSYNAVNSVDLSIFSVAWKTYESKGSIADFNADGTVNTLDFAIWSSNNQARYPTEE